MSFTPPCATLSARRPAASLMTAAVMLPVLANFVVICGFQVGLVGVG